MTEEEALREVRRGSEEALGWLIDRYSAYVSTVIGHILGAAMSEADREEVASDVFLTLWQKAESIRPDSVRPWLGAVARNLARTRLRSLGGELPLEDDLLILDRRTPETELERAELNRAVRRAVLDMDRTDREIFLRHYFHGQPLLEISAAMDIGLNTVKSRLRRGREKLRAALSADDRKEGGDPDGSQNL